MAAKTPADRYQSMEAVIAALECCLPGDDNSSMVSVVPVENRRPSEFRQRNGNSNNSRVVARATAVNIGVNTAEGNMETINWAASAVDTDPKTGDRPSKGLAESTTKSPNCSTERWWKHRRLLAGISIAIVTLFVGIVTWKGEKEVDPVFVRESGDNGVGPRRGGQAHFAPKVPENEPVPAGSRIGTNSKDILVGMSAAFRGPSRGLSIELYRGSLAYFEHINRMGGVHGRTLRIKAYDDGYNPIPAIENTIRLVDNDNVFLLFDYMGTATVTRVLPLLKNFHDNEQPVYLFFPFTGAQPQRQFPYSEFVFNLRASTFQEMVSLVGHFVRIGRKRIAVFYQVDAYGGSGWDSARRTLALYDVQGNLVPDGAGLDSKQRLKMVAEASYVRGTKFSESLRPQVEILRKAEPDAVISVGTYSACAAFVRDARDLEWNVPIANLSGVDSENLLALLVATGEANGRDYTSNLINSQVVPSYDDESLPAIRQYRELMTRYRPAPQPELLDQPYTAPQYSYISCEGFLNAKVLVEVLNRLGPNPQQSRIQEVVESLADFDLGIDVPVSFGPHRHQGMDKVYCTTVAGGRFVPLAEEDWQQWRK